MSLKGYLLAIFVNNILLFIDVCGCDRLRGGGGGVALRGGITSKTLTLFDAFIGVGVSAQGSARH